MLHPSRRAATLFSRMAYAAFLALLIALALGVFLHSSPSALSIPAVRCVASLFLGVLVLKAAGRLAGHRKTLLLLLLLCLAVKLAWVLWVRISPESDYRTFYTAAQQLAEQPVLHHPRYLALFPHLMGYAWFLSLFFQVWGSSELLPPLLNVFLSVVSTALLFRLARRLAGLEVATAAALLWIVCPSQTIYNMFALSEPLYTTLILLFLCVLVEVSVHGEASPLLWAGAGGGLAVFSSPLSKRYGRYRLFSFSVWRSGWACSSWTHGGQGLFAKNGCPSWPSSSCAGGWRAVFGTTIFPFV